MPKAKKTVTEPEPADGTPRRQTWREYRKQLRVESGMTPKQVARRIGVCEAYYRRMERHGCDSPGRAERLANLFKVPIDTYTYK